MNFEQTRLRMSGRFLWVLGFSLSVGWGHAGFAIDDLGGVKAASTTVAGTQVPGAKQQSHANEVAQLVVDAWKHKVWSLYPVEKLKADEGISSKSKAEAVSMCAARGESEPFVLVLRSEVPLRQDFVNHKQAPDPLPSPVVHISKDAVLTVDSAEWEKAAAALLDGNKTNHLFLPTWSMGKHGQMQGLYFLWHYPAVTKQRWFGTVICAENGELTPEFEERFGAYLKHMRGVIERHGWVGRIFISTMDEPYTYHTNDRAQDIPANNYRVIGNFVRFVRKVAPGLRTFATADPTPDLNGLIDHWCLRNLDHAAEARERAEKFGEVVTFCDNYRTFIDYPAVSSRSFGWLAWKFGARGWLTYETLGSFANAWEGPVFVYPQFGGATVWGMGQFFYPATGGQGYVAPSLRWELMRKGCEDYEYLWLLNERLKGLSPEQQNGPLAKEARELLAGAANQIVGGTGDAEIATKDRQPNAQSNRIPHTIHQRIGDLIEQLSSK